MLPGCRRCSPASSSSRGRESRSGLASVGVWGFCTIHVGADDDPEKPPSSRSRGLTSKARRNYRLPFLVCRPRLSLINLGRISRRQGCMGHHFDPLAVGRPGCAPCGQASLFAQTKLSLHQDRLYPFSDWWISKRPRIPTSSPLEPTTNPRTGDMI